MQFFFQETEDEGVPILPKELKKAFTEEVKFELSYSWWITISMVEKKKKKEELTVQTEEANKSKGENHGSFGEPQLVL